MSVLVHPRISVVIPSFNQGRYLEEALKSVVNQNYPETELVVIDGGSADRSPEIIRQYSQHIHHWVSEPDRGQSHAINKGFARCTGEIITFLGADDRYLPGTFHDLAKRWPILEKYGAVVGAFRFLEGDADNPGIDILPVMQVETPADLTLGPPGVYRLHQSSTFYLRHALDGVGRSVREDLHYVMDRELLYRVCKKFPLLLIDTAYGVFRRHRDSKSMSAIIPFSKEFARLYLESMTGRRDEDLKRARMARYRMGRGHLKQAMTAGNRVDSISSLLKAFVADPGGCLNLGYLRLWRKSLERAS